MGGDRLQVSSCVVCGVRRRVRVVSPARGESLGDIARREVLDG